MIDNFFIDSDYYTICNCTGCSCSSSDPSTCYCTTCSCSIVGTTTSTTTTTSKYQWNNRAIENLKLILIPTIVRYHFYEPNVEKFCI